MSTRQDDKEPALYFALRNPFPYQGTVSVEGARASAEAEPGPGAPTLVLDPVAHTSDIVKRYLRQFVLGKRRDGQFALLRGVHGSGKTHTISFVRGRVDARDPALVPEGIEATQVYVKADGPEFLSLYRSIVAGLPLDVLRKLGLAALASAAEAKLGADLQDEEARESAAEVLREDPERVRGLFDAYLVEEGAVEGAVAKEVKELAGRDFSRALSFMMGVDPTLRELAYDWLCGRGTTSDRNERLGVAQDISTAEAAMAALRLLAMLFGRGSRPLIVYVDQYEKLVLDANGERLVDNIGRLRSLVEIIPRANGMLLVAGTEGAWEEMPRDLRDRFGDNLVTLAALSPEEAIDVVRLYLTPPERKFVPLRELDPERPVLGVDALSDWQIDYEPPRVPRSPAPSVPDLEPFEVLSILAMLRYSGGNFRKFLQIAASVADLVEHGSTVTPALVKEAVKRGGRLYFEKDTVLDEIQRIFAAHGIASTREYRAGNLEADLAVLDGRGRPRVLIELQRALFHPDEAYGALHTVDLVERAATLEAPPRIVVVALGYVSPEVMKKLRPLTGDVLVYDRETFRSRFEALLEQLPEQASAAGPDLTAEIRRTLEEVLATRQQTNVVIEQRLGDLSARREGPEAAWRQEVRRSWAEERRRIEEQIQSARAERRKNALDELAHLVDRAERIQNGKRNSRLTMVAIIAVVAGIATGMVLWLGDRRFFTTFSIPLSAMYVLLPAFVGAYVSSLLWWSYRRSVRDFEEISERVRSLEELDRAAHAFAKKGRYLPEHPHPHVRYAATIVAHERRPDIADLEHWLKSEPCSIVRVAVARLVGDEVARHKRSLSDVVEDAGSVGEIVYAIEPSVRAGRAGGSPTWPRHLAVLESLCDPRLSPQEKMTSLFEPGLELRRSVSEALVRALEYGIDAGSARVIAEIPEMALASVEALLSPFVRDRLGTFDALACAEAIQRHYLLVRQIVLLHERGLFDALPEAAGREDREVQPSKGPAVRGHQSPAASRSTVARRGE